MLLIVFINEKNFLQFFPSSYFIILYISLNKNKSQCIRKYWELIFMQAIIPNLTVNTVYEIVVRGATRSTINSHLIQGESSTPTKVLVTRDCDKIPPLMHRSNIKDLTPGVIAGMVCACFIVMLAITAFVLWK